MCGVTVDRQRLDWPWCFERIGDFLDRDAPERVPEEPVDGSVVRGDRPVEVIEPSVPVPPNEKNDWITRSSVCHRKLNKKEVRSRVCRGPGQPPSSSSRRINAVIMPCLKHPNNRFVNPYAFLVAGFPKALGNSSENKINEMPG